MTDQIAEAILGRVKTLEQKQGAEAALRILKGALQIAVERGTSWLDLKPKEMTEEQQMYLLLCLDNISGWRCPRCWHYHDVYLNFGHTPEEVSVEPWLGREKLCDKCQRIILTDYPEHASVPYIKASLKYQKEAAEYYEERRKAHQEKTAKLLEKCNKSLIQSKEKSETK